MNDTNVSAGAAILNAINWKKVPSQDIIEAAKRPEFGIRISDWLTEKTWEQKEISQEAPKSEEEVSLLPTLNSFRKDLPFKKTSATPMKKLFRNGHGVTYYHRDSCLDNWFSEDSPEGQEDTFRIDTTPTVMKFRKMAQAAAGIVTDSIPALSRAIVEQGLDITPGQWNDLIIATQAGEDILLTNTWATFAFSKTGKVLKDEEGKDYEEIVVLYARRVDDGKWDADAYRLDYSFDWSAGYRLLLRNKS